MPSFFPPNFARVGMRASIAPQVGQVIRRNDGDPRLITRVTDHGVNTLGQRSGRGSYITREGLWRYTVVDLPRQRATVA